LLIQIMEIRMIITFIQPYQCQRPGSTRPILPKVVNEIRINTQHCH
jgi:hypothetical protein